jgi:hypothetical protein
MSAALSGGNLRMKRPELAAIRSMRGLPASRPVRVCAPKL